MILVLKMTNKYTHNMILMSKYKGQHGGKKGSKNSGKALTPPTPPQAEQNRFFFCDVFP